MENLRITDMQLAHGETEFATSLSSDMIGVRNRTIVSLATAQLAVEEFRTSEDLPNCLRWAEL